MRLSTRVIALAALFALACEAEPQGTPDPSEVRDVSSRTGDALAAPPCDLDGAAVETGGHRRLALLVGVGEYRDAKIPDLKGPPHDAESMRRLLTDGVGDGGYGFPEANVCVLLNERATKANVLAAFHRALIDRARDGDIAVFYFTGHGSRVPDRSGDEPDGLDETFVLHDSGYNPPRDHLVDDEVNELLSELHEKTANVTVLLDSCNSGTGSRGERQAPSSTTRVARYVEPAVTELPDLGDDVSGIGDGERIEPKSLPGLVVLSAARSGTLAYEEFGSGYFTRGLVEILEEAPPGGYTWANVSTRLQATLQRLSDGGQAPWFEGALDRVAFGVGDRRRARAFTVTATSPPRLRGIPGPGVGKGAHLRVYPDTAEGTDLADPAKAKGQLLVDGVEGFEITASVIGHDPGLEIGDIGVLSVASSDSVRLRLQLATSGEGALPSDRAAEVRRKLEEAQEIPQRVELIDSGGGFRLEESPDGNLQLRGPGGVVRARFEGEPAEQVRKAVENIGQHATQAALMALEGEGGSSFQNDETLTARVVRAGGSACSATGFVQACPNEEQLIPMCTIWEIEVTNNSAVDLLVGGAAMWNDGGITGIPSKGEQFLLPAGATARIPSAKFRARPPLDAPELVAIFGTRVEDPVRWDLLTSPAFRSSKDLTGTLEKVFRKVLAGARGSDLVEEEEDLSTWTSTKLPIRVVANAQMIERSEHERRCQTEKDREYTVNDFDIRPYLPRDRNSPLRRVLETAHALAIRGNHDGIPYKQHAWTPGDDDANLAKGIDCSRAIWWAFTRAGLPYNSDDEYLWTGRMFGDETPMTEQFNECSSDDLRTGDVLVYYGTNSHGTPSGHTVMVIDPERRIAWGSHGWDGNPKLGTGMEADTGVEYQHIRNRPHWKNWDSSRMTLRACWRYKRFAGRSSRALGDLSELRCNDTTCQVVMP